jgi:hypothetical protein
MAQIMVPHPTHVLLYLLQAQWLHLLVIMVIPVHRHSIVAVGLCSLLKAMNETNKPYLAHSDLQQRYIYAYTIIMSSWPFDYL